MLSKINLIESTNFGCANPGIISEDENAIYIKIRIEKTSAKTHDQTVSEKRSKLFIVNNTKVDIPLAGTNISPLSAYSFNIDNLSKEDLKKLDEYVKKKEIKFLKPDFETKGIVWIFSE